jgi:hypothetical protein
MGARRIHRASRVAPELHAHALTLLVVIAYSRLVCCALTVFAMGSRFHIWARTVMLVTVTSSVVLEVARTHTDSYVTGGNPEERRSGMPGAAAAFEVAGLSRAASKGSGDLRPEVGT